MRKKTILIPFLLVAILAGGTGAVFAYDGSRGTEIAKGIRVAGVDVGGLAPAEARAVLQQELVGRLERPIRVHHGERTWSLGPKEARITTNVDALISDAVRRSEDGGVLKRTLRRVTGGRLDAELEPQVTYSDRAVVRLVDRVRRAVARPARDAQLRLTAAGPEVQDGRRGIQVQASALHEAIAGAMLRPEADRSFTATTRKVAPKVTRKVLLEKNPVVLVADRAANTLKLYKDLELVKTYGVAAGQPAWPTPAGEFTIANKAVNPTWSVPTSTWAGDLGGSVVPGGSPQNPLKARWLGITDGVGIHGTSDDGSIGSNASHGCLRMHVPDVIDLFPRVPVGSRILIT